MSQPVTQLQTSIAKKLAIAGLVLFVITQGMIVAIEMLSSRMLSDSMDSLMDASMSDMDTMIENMSKLKRLAIGAIVLHIFSVTMLALSLFYYKFRARWFFWSVVISAIVMIFAFPVGTTIGVAFLWGCYSNRDEFQIPAKQKEENA